ncbi:MAG: acyltransferase [Solirubrobacterales bacterium]|nr:acyltransferase [Solirubrobacterales bacterium]
MLPLASRLVALAGAAALLVAGPSTTVRAAGGPTGPAASAPTSRCFGAAAHDASAKCRDPKLRLTVLPTPEDALLEPNGRCTPVGQTKILLPCAFGVAKKKADAVVALVGDSHASHWRAALEDTAQERNWRGISITRSSCPFSRAVARLDDPGDQQACRDWNRASLAWFTAHPRVHTVFVSEHSGGRVLVPAGSTTERTQVAGYLAVWKALPASVTRIFVIRDTPRNASGTADCVERAMAAKKPAGPACAVPLKTALRPDPAVTAAAQAPGDRVKVVDLTSFMCSSRLCLPVIGGALVHKDIDHLTQTFSASLGPFLTRRVVALGVPGAPETGGAQPAAPAPAVAQGGRDGGASGLKK